MIDQYSSAYFHSVVTNTDRSVVIWSISIVVRISIQLWLIWSISCAYFHPVVTKINQLLYDRSVVRFQAFVTKIDQLLYDRSVVRIACVAGAWNWAGERENGRARGRHVLPSACYAGYSAYFHSVVTKIDQLLYDRSVVRIFIQLWLKSIICYMIDQ